MINSDTCCLLCSADASASDSLSFKDAIVLSYSSIVRLAYIKITSNIINTACNTCKAKKNNAFLHVCMQVENLKSTYRLIVRCQPVKSSSKLFILCFSIYQFSIHIK